MCSCVDVRVAVGRSGRTLASSQRGDSGKNGMMRTTGRMEAPQMTDCGRHSGTMNAIAGRRHAPAHAMPPRTAVQRTSPHGRTSPHTASRPARELSCGSRERMCRTRSFKTGRRPFGGGGHTASGVHRSNGCTCMDDFNGMPRAGAAMQAVAAATSATSAASCRTPPALRASLSHAARSHAAQCLAPWCSTSPRHSASLLPNGQVPLQLSHCHG